MVVKKKKPKKKADPPVKVVQPATYAELAKMHEVLAGTSAKAVPVDTGLLIALIDADAIVASDIEKRREAVGLVVAWARSRFPTDWIEGVVVYDKALATALHAVGITGSTITRMVSHRRYPDRWSKDVVGRQFDLD